MNMADSNQDKVNPNNSDIELDPIMQGADRVKGQREEDAHLDSANIDETQDTQTRANIHLGSREAEGSGLAHEEGQTFPSSSTENTQVEGSPVHTNIEQAEVKVSAFMAEEFEPEAEIPSDAPVLTAGVATSELSFDPITQNTTAPQVGEVQPGTTAQTIESGSRQSFVPENLAANVPPVASDDVGVLTEDEAFTLNVLNNDKDANTDREQLFIVDATVDGGLGAVSHDGTNITFNPGSAYDYLDDGETETVTITYSISDGEGGTDTATLTLEIVGSNDAPVVNAVDLGTTLEDTSVTFSAADLLAGATDVDGEALNVTAVTVDASYGTVVDNGDGTYSFTPAADYNGTDVPLNFTVSDGTASTDGTATIDVTAVNDGPVAASAVDTVADVGENGSVTIDVLSGATDVDGDSLAVTTATVSSGDGSVTVNADGTLSYDPGTAYNGLDDGETATVEISYEISDG
ncbi:MAG: hypothetical protein COA81_06120, partial [Alphaproteobacteria bacterium]